MQEYFNVADFIINDHGVKACGGAGPAYVLAVLTQECFKARSKGELSKDGSFKCQMKVLQEKSSCCYQTLTRRLNVLQRRGVVRRKKIEPGIAILFKIFPGITEGILKANIQHQREVEQAIKAAMERADDSANVGADKTENILQEIERAIGDANVGINEKTKEPAPWELTD